jgi:hypothetical protein
MDLEGVVRNGAIVPDDANALPEGTRVRITEVSPSDAKTFGNCFASFKGAAAALPVDLASQHDHYRLGTAKR